MRLEVNGEHVEPTLQDEIGKAACVRSHHDLLKQLLPKTGPAVKAGGGQFLARSDKITPLVGDPPKRFVIIAFDSVAQAKDWHRSPAQQEVNAMVEKSERVRSFIVDSAM
jgi:uncharacterized protein (DUF1330 family)